MNTGVSKIGRVSTDKMEYAAKLIIARYTVDMLSGMFSSVAAVMGVSIARPSVPAAFLDPETLSEEDWAAMFQSMFAEK